MFSIKEREDITTFVSPVSLYVSETTLKASIKEP